MAIRRKCEGRKCANGRRCLAHLQFDLTYQGERYRMMVNDFAIPRMAEGRRRPVESIQEARDWERLFIGEIKAGRDPRAAPQPPAKAAADLQHVAGFLDAYFERHVRPAGLRSNASIRSRIGVLKQYLGEPPIKRLEQPEDINRFKLDSEYATCIGTTCGTRAPRAFLPTAWTSASSN